MPKNMSGTEAKRLVILRGRAFHAQGGLCYWCKQPMKKGAPDSDPLQLTGDHLIPMHNGGQTIPGNIVAACKRCNNGRHPELTPMGGGLVGQAGNATPRSPFEILRAAR